MSDEYNPLESLKKEVERFFKTNTFTGMLVTHFYAQARCVISDYERLQDNNEKLVDLVDSISRVGMNQMEEVQILTTENERLKTENQSLLKDISNLVDTWRLDIEQAKQSEREIIVIWLDKMIADAKQEKKWEEYPVDIAIYEGMIFAYENCRSNISPE